MTGGVSWLPTGLYNEETLYLLDAYVRSSTPTADANGWYASGANRSGQTLALVVNVECLPKGAVGSYSLKTRQVTVDPGRSGVAELKCKTGQVPVGGGGAWHKPGQATKAGLNAFLTSSRPDIPGRSWLVAGHSDATVILILQVRVLCVSKASIPGCCGSATYISFANFTQQLKATGTCIQGRPLTGGYFWNYDSHSGTLPRDVNTDSRAHVQSSTLANGGQAWYLAGAMTDIYVATGDFGAIVVCAGT